MTEQANNSAQNQGGPEARRPLSGLGSEPHTFGIDEPSFPQGKPPKNLGDAMIKALRPKQWVKNFFLFAGTVFTGAVGMMMPFLPAW